MVLSTLSLLQDVAIPVNFLCHSMIFIGGFYVALHSRVLPHWLTTCIWYIGLASALNLVAMGLQFVYGSDFFLAYAQISVATEAMLNIMIATTMAIMFVNTVFKDFTGRTKRFSKSK